MTTPLLERPHRQIASMWHDGQWSALYSYASTGNITEHLTEELFAAIREAAEQGLGGDVNDLNALLQFVHLEITS